MSSGSQGTPPQRRPQCKIQRTTKAISYERRSQASNNTAMQASKKPTVNSVTSQTTEPTVNSATTQTTGVDPTPLPGRTQSKAASQVNITAVGSRKGKEKDTEARTTPHDHTGESAGRGEETTDASTDPKTRTSYMRLQRSTSAVRCAAGSRRTRGKSWESGG